MICLRRAPAILAVLIGRSVGLCGAQSLNLSLSAPSVLPGGFTTLTVAFQDGTPTANLAGAQWTLTLPAGITAGTPVAISSALSAGKVISSNGATGISLVVGNGPIPNMIAMGTGGLATIPLTVAGTMAAGTQSIALLNVLGTDPAGIAVSLSSLPVTLRVLSKLDLNGDGLVNSADIQLSLNQATGTAPCSNGDVNGDGKCNLFDVAFEIIQAIKGP